MNSEIIFNKILEKPRNEMPGRILTGDFKRNSRRNLRKTPEEISDLRERNPKSSLEILTETPIPNRRNPGKKSRGTPVKIAERIPEGNSENLLEKSQEYGTEFRRNIERNPERKTWRNSGSKPQKTFKRVLERNSGTYLEKSFGEIPGKSSEQIPQGTWEEIHWKSRETLAEIL